MISIAKAGSKHARLVGLGALAALGAAVAAAVMIARPADDSTARSAQAESDSSPLPAAPTEAPAAALAPIQWDAPPVDPARLEAGTQLATDNLMRGCDQQGRFTYQVHLDPEVQLAPSYNILRHAGAMYALEMSYARSPSPQLRDVLLRAARFLRETSIAPVGPDSSMRAVWSYAEINHGEVPAQAKLGGTGLGLVALAGLERIQPGTTPRDELRKLGEFLLFMQKPDGSFFSKYFPGQGRSDDWVSLYYPGEAALGLLQLYELDPSPRWLQAAADAIGFLVRRGESADGEVLPDHWMLLAAARLLPLYDRCDPPVARERIEAHVKRTCRRMIADQRPFLDDEHLSGCFVADGRTCPTSIRLEGILAAVETVRASDEDLARQIELAAARGIRYLLRCQITAGRHAGGIPCIDPKLLASGRVIDDELLARGGEIRVDYIQHALSAMIQYQDLTASRAASGAVPATDP